MEKGGSHILNRLSTPMTSSLAILRAMRPRQWTKNLVLFAGIIFAQELMEWSLLCKVVLAFLLFCLISSAVYLLNDVVDIERDRLHPQKRFRPLASGQIKPRDVLWCALLLGIASLALAFQLQFYFGLIALSYVFLQLLYMWVLKNMVILDVFAIAGGFVLRMAAGAVAIEVEISSWLFVCTILLALFLALSKRRHELVLLSNNASAHRGILTEYSPYLLDQMIAVVTASTLMSYCLYTLWPETLEKFGQQGHNLKFTIPFVIFGIFRYLYLVHQKESGGSPDKILLTDLPLMIDILLWGVSVFVILYL